MSEEDLINVLKTIELLEGKVGIDIYEISVDTILESYSEHFKECSKPTLYRYLKTLVSEKIIQIEKRIVEQFVMVKKNEHITSYFVDTEKNTIPPKDLPIYIPSSQGEKTLTFYKITEKGKKFMEENEK